jgi:mannosyl-oligosaccharide alpha-1,2-mannosidase
MYVYDPEKYAFYGERFKAAADSTIAHLLSSPSSRPDFIMAGWFKGQFAQNESQQLACFMGGSFILASTVFDNPDYQRHGLEFSQFCANGYQTAPSGIGT